MNVAEEDLKQPMVDDEMKMDGGRKSRRAGRKSRRGGRKSRKSRKVHKSRKVRKVHKKHHSAGKRKSCPKYCRRKSVRCKTYKRVRKSHKRKSHRRHR